MRFSEIRRPHLSWQKSSFCASGECTEIAKQGNMIILRNSTRPRKIVRYTADEWRAFTSGLMAGEFQDLD
jgi:Domain of unknown function (DUF397)